MDTLNDLKKVIEIHFSKQLQESNVTKTGLILKLEDGTLLHEHSTDVIMPYEQPNPS